MDFDLNRRQFMGVTGAALMARAFPSFGAGNAPVRTGSLVKGRKINIACVGCGGKGTSDIASFSGENIVGLCDVNALNAATEGAKHPQARIFRDWREMLVTLDDQIDAVVVSTPDHMHFPIAMMAMEMGKHVYVQKPMAHTVTEARLMLEQARRHQVVTQMGNQGHSNEGTRRLKELIAADVIGEVREVHLWTNRPVWPQNLPLPEPSGLQPPPTLDWNRWLGVAPWRPYNGIFQPFAWRGWWEYGTGAIGDMGCHTMDACFWALELGAPSHVAAHVEGGSEYSCPAGSVITYTFPARGKFPPVTVKWFDGCCKPPRPAALETGFELAGSGQLYYGSKGVIMAPGDYCENPYLIPRSAQKALKRPPKTLPRVPNGHYQNWLDGIRGLVAAPVSNFEYAAPLTEMAMLGAIAVRARTSFNWDSATLRCDTPMAQRYVDKTYRMF